MKKDFLNDENLTFKDLLSFINKDFYKYITTKRQLTEFTRKLLDTYCDEKGIAPVTLTSTNFRKEHFATYFRFTAEIKINNLLLKGFDHFRETENMYFLQEYFDTILHELRHHEQFVSACKDFHPVVKYTAQIIKKYKAEQLFDSFSYYCNPTELDARYFAYTKLKNNESLKPYFLSDDYRDEEITSETKGAFDYATLFKDKGLWKVKGIAKPLRLLETSIAEIAFKYRLYFVSNKAPETREINWSEAVNNVKLSERVSQQIAPEFYSDNFIFEDNPIEVEEKVMGEIEDYHKYINAIIKVEKAHRDALRKKRKENSKNNKPKSQKTNNKQLDNTDKQIENE